VALRCATAAATIMHEAAAGGRATRLKGATSGGRSDLVTETDPAIERAVMAILRDAYPEHAVLGEETGGAIVEHGWSWVIDPIDGTRNFGAGIPLVAFNLALYGDGQPRLALTQDALHDEQFYAESGAGGTVNGRPLAVSRPARVADAVLAVDLGMDDTRGRALLGELHGLFPGVQALRIPGTVALGMAYVAAGRIDAYLHPSAFAWDFAPGVLLVREAGGLVSEIDGTPVTLMSRSVLCSGPLIADELINRFAHVVAGAIAG